MPPQLEARDYIGLGPAAPASSCSSSSASAAGEPGPHLALRLGLPGCESPGRAEADAVDAALTLGPAPAPAPHRGGAKRGFADSLDRSATKDAAASAAGGARDVQKGTSEAAAGAPPAAK
jgi:auxin-responsive protein IAA